MVGDADAYFDSGHGRARSISNPAVVTVRWRRRKDDTYAHLFCAASGFDFIKWLFIPALADPGSDPGLGCLTRAEQESARVYVIKSEAAVLARIRGLMEDLATVTGVRPGAEIVRQYNLFVRQRLTVRVNDLSPHTNALLRSAA